MIEPTHYQRKLEGKSNAHLMTFNDGNDYVVKYFQPGFEKTLPNEWISYCLGRYLGLPIPFAKLINIPPEFSAQIPDFAPENNIPYQFASLYVPNCQDAHHVSTIAKISNDTSLASIIAFDYWLYNRDRTRKNILLQEQKQNVYKLWAIDQAEVFGTYNWQLEDLEKLPDGLIESATHELIARFIEDEDELDEQVEFIQTIPQLLIEEMITMIPDEWMITKEEKKAIVSTLVTRRKKILPKLIKKFIKKVYRPLH